LDLPRALQPNVSNRHPSPRRHVSSPRGRESAV
jgi:hypothetical protein